MKRTVACKVNVGQPQSAGLTYVIYCTTMSCMDSVSWSADFGKLVLYTLIAYHSQTSLPLRSLNHNFFPILDMDTPGGICYGAALEVVVGGILFIIRRDAFNLRSPTDAISIH